MTRLEQLFDGTLPRLVMFDLDGTLMDSVPDLAAAVDKMLMLLGREPAGIERVRDWVGNGSRVLVRRALAGQLDHDGVADELADEALALFMQAYAGGQATISAQNRLDVQHNLSAAQSISLAAEHLHNQGVIAHLWRLPLSLRD